MLISVLFLVLVAVMQAFPDTAVGRGLRHWMVEVPARKLTFLTPKLVIGLLLMTVVVALLAQVVPVGMAMAMATEVHHVTTRAPWRPGMLTLKAMSLSTGS